MGLLSALALLTAEEDNRGRPERVAAIEFLAPRGVVFEVDEPEELIEPIDAEVELAPVPDFDDPDAVDVELPEETAEPEQDDEDLDRVVRPFAPLPSRSLGGSPTRLKPSHSDSASTPIPDDPAESDTAEPQPEPMPAESPEPASSGDELSEPELLDAPPPRYPALARKRHDEGSVLVRILIAGDGTVVDVTVEESSGHDMLDDAALRAVRGWRYVSGEAARIAHHRVTFRLADAA